MRTSVDALAAAVYGYLATVEPTVGHRPARREGDAPRVFSVDVHERDLAVDHFQQEWSNTAVMFSGSGVVAGQAFTKAYTTVIAHRGRLHVFCDGRPAYFCDEGGDNVVDDLRDRGMATVENALVRYDGCTAA